MSTTLVRRTTKVASPLVPIWRDVPADLDTPVSAYLKLARGPYSYLLESVEGGERLARYSFVGVDPYLVLTVRGETAEYRWLGGRHPAIPSPRRGGGARPLAQPLPYEGSGARGGVREYADCHDPLELLQRELARRQFDPMTGLPGAPGFHGGAVGYLAYEVAARFEPSVPVPDRDALGLPEAVFLFSDTLLIFDHVRHTARLVAHMDVEAADGDAAQARTIAERRLDVLERRLRRGRTNAPARAGVRPCVPTEAAGINLDPAGEAGANPAASSGFPSPRRGGGRGVGSALAPRARYEAAVRRATEYIHAGDCFQVVPSRRVARPLAAPPFEVYRALRSINPSPYMFYLALGDFAVAGASPELLVRVERGEVAIHPIAGTRRRGATPAEDAALEAELRSDEKERAEHVMLVDLGRNDVGRVSEPGSVRITQFMDVERYSHVMHLVSHVTGRLRADLTPFDALRVGFPAGTVSGAPKIRAMQIIAGLERERRGVYAGAVGYFGYDGNLDTCIALRSLVLKDGMAYAQAGGGVVADSDPAREFEETENKLGAVLLALKEAEARCSC